ncbi:uncharacterized protein LOC115340055 [Aquila chrysaetos chrysaetos]|uniref:uncharacterized protein LOC115340055 n=1 Tax=Aquila chrysaetos chrysaetos TaxID=223781 RepID=UPI00117731F8|nr:uncharacterized protein LOC115340055 [Aquila chrysaetos chrysaetos]
MEKQGVANKDIKGAQLQMQQIRACATVQLLPKRDLNWECRSWQSSEWVSGFIMQEDQKTYKHHERARKRCKRRELGKRLPEIPDLEIISKDGPQAVYFVQSVSCQRRQDEASPEPLRTRLLSPSFLILGVFQFSMATAHSSLHLSLGVGSQRVFGAGVIDTQHSAVRAETEIRAKACVVEFQITIPNSTQRFRNHKPKSVV